MSFSRVSDVVGAPAVFVAMSSPVLFFGHNGSSFQMQEFKLEFVTEGSQGF
jgi:hypothetical protein